MSLIKVSSMTALFDSLRLLSRENEWHGPSDYFTAAKKCSARVITISHLLHVGSNV